MNPQERPDDREAARRRLVVIHALHELLSEQELREAVAMWDQSFAHTRAFALVSFVSKLDSQLGLGNRSSAVQRSLTQRMFMSEDELTGGPSPQAAQSRSWGESATSAPAPTPIAQPVAAPPPASPAVVVFGALVQGVVRAVVRRLDGTAGLSRYLKKNSAGLSSSGRSQVEAWADTGMVDAPPQLTEPEDMKALMHALYLFACDAFGPPATDRVFSSALRNADELPEASRFSPRKLF